MGAWTRPYLTESVYRVVLQKVNSCKNLSTYPLLLLNEGQVDGFVRELTLPLKQALRRPAVPGEGRGPD